MLRLKCAKQMRSISPETALNMRNGDTHWWLLYEVLCFCWGIKGPLILRNPQVLLLVIHSSIIIRLRGLGFREFGVLGNTQLSS